VDLLNTETFVDKKNQNQKSLKLNSLFAQFLVKNI